MNTVTLAPRAANVEANPNRQRQKKSTPPVPAAVNATVGGVSARNMISDRTKIIVAKINVGWGNSIYIRGEGGCLNWDMGVPMICSGEDRWVWCCHEDEAPHMFKFLRNDQDWALGENQVMSGADITVCNPVFPG